MLTTQYKVSGMTCGHCVNAVTEEISALPGVSQVEVDLATGVVKVHSADALEYSAVGDAVDEAGYDLVEQL
jgi:copper chaperone CopZ